MTNTTTSSTSAAISSSAWPSIAPGRRAVPCCLTRRESLPSAAMNQRAQGRFDITRTAEPPYDTREGAVLGRSRFDKRFEGGLVATSVVQMISAVSGVKGSAGYVAIERVEGTLDGRAGTFVLQHSGTMDRGVASLSVTVVPDTATGDLAGLRGRMQIDIIDGDHRYTFDYDFAPAAP